MKRSRRSQTGQGQRGWRGVWCRAPGWRCCGSWPRTPGWPTGWTDALLDTYKALPPAHLPGRVLADLAVMIADGGDALAHLATLRDQDKLFGAVASDATAWRVVDRVDDAHLARLQAVRAAARERAWAAGAGPDLRDGLVIDSTRRSRSRTRRRRTRPSTWKKTFGFHPLLGYLDRPDVSGGEALAGILRPGQRRQQHRRRPRARSWTWRWPRCPQHARPRPGETDSPAGAGPHRLRRRHPRVRRRAAASRGMRVLLRASPSTTTSSRRSSPLPDTAWTPAYDIDGEPRDGAWVAEITGLLDLASWPAGSRVIVRRERPHPGAQLRFTDADGHRFTAFLTDTARRARLADLEVRHRAHARVEDRIRCGKATGLRNLPCQALRRRTQVWLELAPDRRRPALLDPERCASTGDLARCEPAAFRYRHRCTSPPGSSAPAGAATSRLDRDWPWATDLATAFARLRAAPWPA